MTRVHQSLLGGLDPRALALLRMGLGVLVVVDLVIRARDLNAMYTDAGMLSRADVAELYAFLHDWTFSAFMATGGALWTSALMLVLALAAVALILG